MSLDELTEKDQLVIQTLDNLLMEHQIGMDDFLDILAKRMLNYARHEAHKTVASCFTSCANSLRDASMAFYVSTK